MASLQLPAWYTQDYAGTKFTLKQEDHQKAVRKWCHSVYTEASSELHSSREIKDLDKHVRYIMGQQWSTRRPSYRAAPVDNRIWTNIVQLISYLTDTRQTFEVRPEDPQYKNSAETINKMNRAWSIRRDFDMVVAMACWFSAVGSVGYIRQVWNPELDGNDGDIDVQACSPIEVIPIKPTYDNIQGAMGVVYEKSMPLSWFRNNYPLLGPLVNSTDGYADVKAAKGVVSPATFTADPLSTMSPFQRYIEGAHATTSHGSVIPMGKYREYWLKDFSINTSNVDVYVGNMASGVGYVVPPGKRLYPRGRLIIMGGDIVLYDGPNPHWHGRFPFAALRLNQLPWSWMGVSEVRNQIPLQDTINNILAGILDNVKVAVNPPVQAPMNALSDAQKRTQDPNMPGQRIYYNPSAGQNPMNYAPVPQLPPYVYQALLFAKGELADQTGFIDAGTIASKGLLPGADTLEMLSQGSQTLVRLKVRYIEAFLREVGEQWLPNSFQYYRTPRKILAGGLQGLTWEDWTYDPRQISPSPLDPAQHWKTFKWTIMPGTMLKSQDEPDKAVAMQLYRMGAIDRKSLYKKLGWEELYPDVKTGLHADGADMLANAIKQQMSGVGGGGGIAPWVLKEINNATMEKPQEL